PPQDLLVEPFEVREEIEGDGVAGRHRLDLEQRAAPGTDELADLLQLRVARLRTRVELLEELLGVPHEDQRLELPVLRVGPELLTAIAFDDSLGSFLDDLQVLADREQDPLREGHP